MRGFSIELDDFGLVIIVAEDGVIGKAFAAHHCGTDLTHADTVAPTGSVDVEILGYAFCIDRSVVDDDGGAVEVGVGEGTADFEFLTDDHRMLAAYDAELDEAGTGRTLHGFETKDGAEVCCEFFVQQALGIGLGEADVPTIEILGFLVIGVEHLAEEGGIGGMAEAVGGFHDPSAGLGFVREIRQGLLGEDVATGLEVGIVLLVPAGTEALRGTTAAFREAGVAELVVVDEDFTAGFGHRTAHIVKGFGGDALIALAMVVGADVEEDVVTAVVPADEFVGFMDEAEESLAVGGLLETAVEHLAEEPATRDDGMGLEEFEGGGGVHLGGDDALEIGLGGDFIDDGELLLVDDEMEASAEGLVLLPLPVEVDTDGDVVEGEGGVVGIGGEDEFTVGIAVPLDGAFGIDGLLLSFELVPLGGETAVETEGYLFAAHDTDTDEGFFIEVLHGVSLAMDMVADGGMELAGDGGQFGLGDGHFAEDVLGHTGCHAVEVLTTGRDEEAAHVDGSGTDEAVGTTFSEIAVGTVLATGEDNIDDVFALRGVGSGLPPGEEIEIGLTGSFGTGDGIEEFMQEEGVGLGRYAAHDEGGTGIALEEEDACVLAGIAHFLEFGFFLMGRWIDALEAVLEDAPVFLDGDNAAHAGLQMGMVGSGGSAMGTIVEDEMMGHVPCQTVDDVGETVVFLREVATRGDGEVTGKYGEGIDEDVIGSQHGEVKLLGRTIGITEEAGALLEMGGIDIGIGAADAHGVVLHLELEVGGVEVTGQDGFLEVGKTLADFRPLVELAAEEVIDEGFVNGGVPLADEGLTGVELDGAELVLIGVVGVLTDEAESGIGVSFPTAAEIELIVDAGDAPTTGDAQTEGIVFAVAGVGEADLAEDVGAEGTGRSKTVDAEGVVTAVVGGPLGVGDESGGKGLKVEVDHAIGTDDHSGFSLTEGFNDAEEHVGGGVEVVGVELHGIAAAMGTADGEIPASSDAEVVAFGDEMDNSGVGGEGADDVGSGVGGVVVDNDDVEREGGFLGEDATDGIGDGALTIAHGDDDAGFDGIVCRV